MMRCLRNLILLFVLLTAGLYTSSVHAASTDDLYVAIGQALSAVASEDRTALNQAIDQLGQVATDLPEQQTAISEAVKQVDAKRSAPFPEVRQRLTTLSATVRNRKKRQNRKRIRLRRQK
ncbi:hypothetical protein OVA29_10925 [Exiguobacterium sp. SL14]|nr:hypothetical protein [Exiguobacterium sp. SL14]MCY1691127.1 hypothetical protein [Exiguobacterium sp. SL14]